MEADTSKANTKTKPKPKVTEKTQSTAPVAKNRPKPWYCFQCGKDGHIASACSNDPNPSLVAEKRQQLKNKQNNQNQPLNWNQPSLRDRWVLPMKLVPIKNAKPKSSLQQIDNCETPKRLNWSQVHSSSANQQPKLQLPSRYRVSSDHSVSIIL